MITVLKLAPKFFPGIINICNPTSIMCNLAAIIKKLFLDRTRHPDWALATLSPSNLRFF